MNGFRRVFMKGFNEGFEFKVMRCSLTCICRVLKRVQQQQRQRNSSSTWQYDPQYSLEQ